MWFLEALCGDKGASGFVQTVEAIRGVVQDAFESRSRGARLQLDDIHMRALLTAAENRLVIATGKKGAVERAGPYNAVDLGRWIAAWLSSTGRASLPALNEENYQVVMKGMSQECKDAVSAAGVYSAATLHKKADILNKLAVACTPPPANVVHTHVEWPCVLVHMCEVGQIARDIPDKDVSRVLAADAGITASVVKSRTESLQKEERNSLGCHAVLVTRAALAACDQAYKQIHRALAKAKPILKRPAADSGRARQSVLKKPAFVQVCPICKAGVRNDVIARHMKTNKCRQQALCGLEAHPPPVEGLPGHVADGEQGGGMPPLQLPSGTWRLTTERRHTPPFPSRSGSSTTASESADGD